MDDDATVIRDVLAGNPERFRVLVARYQGVVFAVVRAWLPSRELQEDVAQDGFLRAFRHLRRYDAARGRFPPWLLTIVRNRCRDVLRRRRPEALGDPDAHAAPCLVADDDLAARLDRALAALPEDRRLVFELCEVHGLSQAEVAALEGVAVGTIKSRLHRARAALRIHLAPALEADE